MTSRPRLATTTLAGPSRLVLAAATGGLVALASAGTALLVLTGTSSVAPSQAVVPPLPARVPLAHAPGVVVLPTPPTTSRTPRREPVRPHTVDALPAVGPPAVGPVAAQTLAFVPAAPAPNPRLALGQQPPVPSPDEIVDLPVRLRGRALAAVRRAPIAETVARGLWPAPVGPPGSTVPSATTWSIQRFVTGTTSHARGGATRSRGHLGVRHRHHRHGGRHRHG